MSVLLYTPICLPPVNVREVLRYAGVRGEAPDLEPLLSECIRESAEVLSPRTCYAGFPLRITDGLSDLTFAEIRSTSLQKALEGCRNVLVFAATLGLELDRRIVRAEVASPTKALLLQAIGAERVEALCDSLQAFLREQGIITRPRVSPGYGDIPLAFQQDLFRALMPEKHIGLTLTEHLLMTPTKSVTALAGIVQ